MGSPLKPSSKIEQKSELSSTKNSSPVNENSLLNNPYKIVDTIDKINEPVVQDVVINTNNLSCEPQNVCPERKKKYKPDQLPVIKALLIANFFGLAVIFVHILFVYIKLFSIQKAEDTEKIQITFIILIEIICDLLFITSWIIYFVSSLKRKLMGSKICIILCFASFLTKALSFILFLCLFNDRINNLAYIVVSSIFFSFQLFSIYNYSYVYWKMSNLSEKTWKKAFKRPKGKYMYAQD